MDNKWQSYRVTASLEEVSLHKGLRQILRNLNNVIIYGSSKKIKIIIYDKTAPEGEEKIKSKKLKIEANEGAKTDSQEKSSEESSEQDNQTESTSGGETENSEGAESTYNTQ